MNDDRLAEIKHRFVGANGDPDVAWLIAEVERLRNEVDPCARFPHTHWTGDPCAACDCYEDEAAYQDNESLLAEVESLRVRLQQAEAATVSGSAILPFFDDVITHMHKTEAVLHLLALRIDNNRPFAAAAASGTATGIGWFLAHGEDDDGRWFCSPDCIIANIGWILDAPDWPPMLARIAEGKQEMTLTPYARQLLAEDE